ncbi:MAG: peptidyl-prolyl cis-trans isomerase SurA [Lentimonas sp.]
MSIKKLKNKNKIVRRIFIASFFLILAIFLAKNALASPNQPVFVVAKVDNQLITNIDLISRYKLILNISKIKIDNDNEKRIILNQVLKKMIDEKLQNQEADNLNISINPEKLNQAQGDIAQGFGVKTSNLSKLFKNKNISHDSFLEQLKSQILWSQLVKKVFVPRIKVNQNEVEELLELKKVNHSINQYFISEIFIPVSYESQKDTIDGKNLAVKLFDEIRSGKDFSSIAKQFSRSPTAEFGGEVGFVGRGDIDDRIYEKVGRAGLNQVTRPMLMNGGYYIFKVTDEKTQSILTDNDRSQIENIIFNKKLQLKARSYLMDLKKGAYIEIDYQALGRLTI